MQKVLLTIQMKHDKYKSSDDKKIKIPIFKGPDIVKFH